MREIKVGMFKIFIRKESGNLYVKDKKDGLSKPILFGAYDSENELVCLRDYMNIKGISLSQAVEKLEKVGAVLTGHTFNIYFYDEESVERFIETTISE